MSVELVTLSADSWVTAITVASAGAPAAARSQDATLSAVSWAIAREALSPHATPPARVSGYFQVGGLVGTNGGTITASHSSGTITGDISVGGLVGTNGGTITASHSGGTITGDISVGGLVGYNSGSIITS